jgi:exo-1,4-beta-D-glucosaminidase
MSFRFLPTLITTVCGLFIVLGPAAHGQSGDVMNLTNGWRIQGAAELASDKTEPVGDAISSHRFSTTGWHAAAVPTTVLGALVKDGVYTNIFFGTNFSQIPRARFTNAWWFRNEFSVSKEQAAGNAELVFEGINYRANIWLNGKQIAATNEIFGAFKVFKLDASGKFKPGKNVLAVEVFPPLPGEFTMGFVDWNPKPADWGMGLFRPVKVHFYKSVALENVFVESKIDHHGWEKAALTIRADLKNQTDHEVETEIRGEISDVKFSESFKVPPGQTLQIALSPEHNPPLNFDHAQLWWPWELGAPRLYNLKLTASDAGETLDRAQTRFGIREVADYLTPEGYRGYMINGKKILLRGGGWADELLLRESATNLQAQVEYTKAMNLNTIRLEGIWGSSQRLYDLADENGLFIMVGFSCQWEWKDSLGKECDNYGGLKSDADLMLATNYLHDQVLWLRNHPSIFVWVLGSDKLPRPALETRYDTLLADIDPTRPKLKTCGDDASKVSGPSGVKMNGPYDYVTPNYWYDDVKNGGAFGFNTETGPGPQPPPLESLQRMFPADHLWPMDSVWKYHCARGHFGSLDRYFEAFTNRYGSVTGVDEFAFKSQAANYEAIRPMYEAFAVNLPHTTGIIQWMLNPSWPKMFWQLYDYYLVPGGAFFGAKKGAAPMAVIYNYGNQGVYVVNQTGKDFGSRRTTITVYDLNSKIVLEQTVTNADPIYGSQKIFDLSTLAPPTPVHFVNLHSVTDAGPAATADNFYWLSTRPDVLDEAKTQWYVTPIKSFADLTALNEMPDAQVQSGVSYKVSDKGTDAEVTLKNTGDTLAFFIEMRIVGADSQQSLTPVLWDDNYVSLPPQATKVFHAHFPTGEKPELKLRGWNVKF